MLQQIMVALIVALAAIYAVWHWMPSPWRRSAALKLAAGSQRVGWVDAQGADQLAASLGKASGCAACGKCGSGVAKPVDPAGVKTVLAVTTGACGEVPRTGVH